MRGERTIIAMEKFNILVPTSLKELFSLCESFDGVDLVVNVLDCGN